MLLSTPKLRRSSTATLRSGTTPLGLASLASDSLGWAEEQVGAGHDENGRLPIWLKLWGALLMLLLLLIPAHHAQADRKTDVITLYNGDRLTGEIESLEEGRLSFATDSMGTVKVEWKEVASVESRYNYELRLTNGQRFFGSVHAGSVPGTIALTDVFGEKSFGWQEVVELRPIEEKLAERFDIYLSANYAFTKASGVAQTELNATVGYNERDAVNTLTARLTLSDTDDESTTSSRINLARQFWTERQSFYRKFFGGFESNDELGLQSRYTIGGGIGRYVIDTNRATLTGSIGAQALTETGTDGVHQESIEAVITADFSAWRFETPELDLAINGNIYPSLTESGRMRADSTARIRWEIVEDLFWNMNLWGSYDNASVDIDGSEFDWGVTTGLGWTF